MKIIVAGSLKIKVGSRNEFIEKSKEAILLARSNSSCLNFSVSPDPIDESRVNIFEKWISVEALNQFRQDGPENDSFSLVESFDKI